ncbi:MAG: hypothetical protein J4F98_06155 [Acidobacteria bacterium]|nr:hypothetical protein [Acidobacteriota bacterium]
MNTMSETGRSARRAFRALPAARSLLVGLGALAAVLGLACAEPLDEPNEDSLKASFVAQIEADEYVRDLNVYGNEIHFARRDGSGEHVEWEVRIDSLSVEPWAGDEADVAGRVVSGWSVAGRPVSVEVGPNGLVTDMPIWVLDAGLAPECWALWDEEAKTWGW